MLHWFRKKSSVPAGLPLQTDVHSHLLPGLDDGVQDFTQALDIIRHFHSLGYRRLITTPHVMSDTYRNTSEGILSRLQELQHVLKQAQIDVTVEAAAEYYLDEAVYRMLTDDVPMLTFGQRHLLFETNFLTEPFNLREFIFLANTKGYKPVLAHPERYLYLQNDLGKAEDLLDRGVLFQVNISSLTGYYSRPAQLAAQKLIDRGWVHLLGSDCHHQQHAQLVAEARTLKYFQKALTLPLLNHTV